MAMNEQGDLFGARTKDAEYLSRHTDPATSKIAAERLALSGELANQRAKVLRVLRETPGLTSAELADRHGLDRYMTARRLPDLAVTGKARRGTPRICAVKGSRAITWWAI